MAQNILAKMAVQISANTAEFGKALQKTNKDINSFTTSIKDIAGTLGIAFGTQQIASFALEVAKLSGEAEGVRIAFNKFENSGKLLNDLKEATSNTVSELDLMKRTVQGANFGISLGALPKLLEFAAVRAQQTGQSVDYLVDSIVTGIGRKSPLILDNLGISAVALKEKLDGVSIAEASVGQVADAVGKIAEDSLTKMGKLSINTATNVQQLAAEWVNLKVAIGDLINQAGAPKAVSFFTEFVRRWSLVFGAARSYKEELRDLELAIGTFNKQQPRADDFLEAYDKLEKMAGKVGVKLVLLTDEATGLRKVLIDPRTPAGIKKTDGEATKLVSTLDILKEKQKELNEEFSTTDINDKKALANIGNQIIAINKQIEAIEKLKTAQTSQLPKLQFIVPELSGDNANTKAANDAKQFAIDIAAIGTSAEFAGGALIKLDDTISTTFTETAKEAIDISSSIAGGIIQIADAFGEAAVSGRGFGDAILKSVAGFAQQFGAILIATGIGEIAFKKFSGPQMIAAGAALVALGGAVRATIANRPNLGSSGGSGGRGSISGGGSFGSTGLGQGIMLSGDFELQGYSLQLLLDKQTYKNGRVGG